MAKAFVPGRSLASAFCLLGLALAQTPAPAAYTFPPDEAAKALAFWAQPGRYTASVPDNFHDVGVWQVRLTVAGSQWISSYNHARHVTAPPTQDAQAVNPQQQVWDQWIQSKVDRDRWEAYQTALAANQKVLGATNLPLPDRWIPATEPPKPTPIPPDLLALAGPPPRFAEAVVPMAHKVTFDDDTLTYMDNAHVSAKYPYFRFAQGVMDEGKALKTLTTDRIHALLDEAGIDHSTAHVMMAVSSLEGGFDSINTYDTGYVSVGFIQFACLGEGGGSLGGMMLEYKQDKPDKFESDFQRFGIDVSPDGKLDVIDPDMGAEYHGPDAARKIIQDKRLIAVFGRAAQVGDDFTVAQLKSAKSMFYPGDNLVTLTIGGSPVTVKVSDVFKSEAGLATIMDRYVNTGGIGQLGAVLQAAADQIHATSIADLAKFEADLVGAMRYRTDFLKNSALTQPAPSPYALNLPTPGGKG